MKKTLLTVCVLALTSISAKAQWTAPELPLTTDHIPDAALFYHVGQEMFLFPGTTWGTHAALTDDPTEAYLYEFQDQGGGAYMLYSAVKEDWLGRQDETEVYVDTNSRSWATTWEFYKDETTGYYHIRTAASDPVYGADLYEDADINYGLYELGWDPNNIDVNSSGTELGTNVSVYMLDPAATDLMYQLEWAFVSEEDYTLYVARFALYSSLMDATEVGVPESDLAAYGALLTSEDVDAINEAKEIVDEITLDFSLNTASPDNPQDVTSLISNPTMEGTRGEEPEGDWIDTYGNMLIQNNKAYGLWDEEAGAESTEYGLNNFSQNWTSDNDTPIDASDIHQVLADLPQGRYYLVADCVTTTASESNPVSGCSLYAISNGVTYATPVGEGFTTTTASSGFPLRYYVDVVHFGGDLTIGYGFVPGWVKWFAVDNFQLYYCGGVEGAGSVGLAASISSAQVYIDDFEYTYIYSEATRDVLQDAIDHATDVLDGEDDEACIAEITVLNDMVNVVKAEITSYNNLLSLCEQIQEDMVRYADLLELSEMLSDMYEEYNDAYEDKVATVEEIEAWISAYDPFILDYVKSVMATATADNPIDITVLATNMDYANNSSTEGWTVTTGSAGNSGSYAVSYHVAEVWSNTFACLQTLDDMPAGAYKLQAKAFYRTSSNEATYADYVNGTDEILTYLVVESGKAPVVNQAAGAQIADEAPYTGYSETTDGSGIWVPNTMEAAEYAFNLDDTYLCEVNGYLREDGTLTFGIRNDELTDGNGWSIWSQFSLIYSGPSTSQLYIALMDLVAQAAELDDQVGMLIEAADEKLMSAIAAADDLTENSPEEELQQAYQNLEEAIAYANEGLALISTVTEMAEIYEEMLPTIESSDSAFPALLEEIDEAIGNEEFISNEKMNEWINALPAAWTAFVQYDCLETASIENPADISAVITNPSFDQGTNNNTGATGWTIEYEGDHVGIANTSQQEASDYAFEFWKVSSCDIHQTIVGLAEGYYHLTVQGFFRAGSSNSATVLASYMESEDNDRHVMFYGNNSGVLLYNVYDFAQTEATEADGEVSAVYDGVTYYSPNTMASAYAYFELGYYLNEFDMYIAEGEDLTIGLKLLDDDDSNWCVWDNFTISYLGKEAPTAVEGVTADESVAANAEGIYDLAGRKVAKAQKGIYIVNGKKIVIK